MISPSSVHVDMIMVVSQLFPCVIFLLVVVLLPSSVFSSLSPNPSTTEGSMPVCDRNCPGDFWNGKRFPHPFGFSSGCQIQLNCTETGEVTIGEFRVANVTDDSILINLPVNCSRPIESLEPLFGRNYRMTSRNALLLKNCISPINGCSIPINIFRTRLGGTLSCDSSNTSCYSDAPSNVSFLDFQKVKNAKCGKVFSSIAVDLNNEKGDNSSWTAALSLEFQIVELGWWLEGNCFCGENAKCVNVSGTGNVRMGYRCQCIDGYSGDGFRTGGRCLKVAACHASNYFSRQCGGVTRVAILIGGIITGAVLVTLLALLFYCIRKRSKPVRAPSSAKRFLSEAAGSSSIPFYPYKEIERATNSFSEKQRLGTGAYGTVYAGKLHNDEWVAIKKIKNHDPESIDQVINEVKLLSSVSHPNLVRLLGCCIENGEQILVYEFMPNGTLSQHLQRERGSGLPWTIRLTIATETAHAIAHLHSAMNPPIYHRDIKSSNILLDYNFRSKVADFGLSRFGMTDDSHISTAPQGTPGYVDPQYHQNYHLSDKSDVYSFGVVLLEIITAMKVVDFSRAHNEINLAAVAIERIGKGRLDEIIDPFLEPNRDAWTLSSIHKVAELAFRCLAFHRDMRPSMMEVADELEQIRLSGWAPMEDSMFVGSLASSSCSSPFNGSEKSFSSRTNKKAAAGSRRLTVAQKAIDCLPKLEKIKDGSPVSVQDPWSSEQSSPSTNSLLGNVVH